MQILADLRFSPEGRAAGTQLDGLAEYLAQLRPTGPRPETDSVAALFRLHDGPFLDTLASTVLGLPLAPAEHTRMLARLHAGSPRVVLLGELMARRGGAPARPLAGWEGVREQLQSGLCPVAIDVDDLLSFHDQDFVDCAYKTLVGRPPDPSGLSHYTGLLRAGHSKMSVLLRLARAPECRSRAMALPGLKRSLLRYAVGLVPVLGWLTRALWRTDGESTLERRLRAMDNQLARLQQASARERLAALLAAEQVDQLLAGSPVD
jgi:hypothetical protein